MPRSAATSPNGSGAADDGRPRRPRGFGQDTDRQRCRPESKNDWGDSALTLAMRYDHYRLGLADLRAEEFAVAVQAPGAFWRSLAFGGGSQRNRRIATTDPRSRSGKNRPEELRKKLMLAVDTFGFQRHADQTQRRTVHFALPARRIDCHHRLASRVSQERNGAGMVKQSQKAATTRGKTPPGTISPHLASHPVPQADRSPTCHARIQYTPEARGESTEALKTVLSV